MAETVKLTLDGKNKLEQELNELKTVKRQEIAEKIKVARSYGDLSENSEYDEAKNEQAMVEARIMKLEATLKNVVIVSEEKKASKKVIKLGTKVKLLDVEDNEEEVYELVSSIEVNLFENKISDSSPLGGALLGKKAGDTIEVEAPIGTLKYKILEIVK